MKPGSPNHPWRWLVIGLGALFVVSAWLYCLATLATIRRVEQPHAAAPESGLLMLFRDYGEWVLGLELLGLTLCTALLWKRERLTVRGAQQRGEVPPRDDGTTGRARKRTGHGRESRR